MPAYFFNRFNNKTLTYLSSGTLVIPVWPSAYFWPLIYPRGKAIATFVKDFYVFDPFFKSSCSISVFKGHAKFRTIALKIAF